MNSTMDARARGRELIAHYRSLVATQSDADPSPEILQALRDVDVIDEVRGMTETSDRDLIVRLAQSEGRDRRLAAHILGRRFVYGKQDRDVYAAFEQAYKRAIDEDDLFLQVSFFHDLVENPDFAVEHRDEYVELVRSRPSDVRDVLLEYSRGAEETLLKTFTVRLEGVLTSEELSRYNTRAKAFVYALYLGLVLDPGLRERARRTLEEWLETGDEYFREVAKSQIELLRA